MYTLNHLIWVIICAVVITFAVKWLVKNKPSLEKVLTVCCVGCVFSEFIKVFSVIQMVPSADGATVYPYIEMQHMPLHLCSLQIILIFYTRFAKEGKVKNAVLAFMYPTCIAGAAMALAIPTIFKKSVPVAQAFVHPMAYQFFLYHSMLIVLGLYIFISKQVELKPKHYCSSMAILAGLGFASLYLNSILAVPTYIRGKLISVDYIPNLFFTYRPPINIKLTEIWHWYIYIAVIAIIALIVVGAFYIPVVLRHKKEIIKAK